MHSVLVPGRKASTVRLAPLFRVTEAEMARPPGCGSCLGLQSSSERGDCSRLLEAPQFFAVWAVGI